MLGAIIVITFCYYLFSFAFGWGLAQANADLPWVGLIAPPLLAGLFGGVQFVRTEARKLHLLGSLRLTFQSCLAIVLTPIAISFVLTLAQMLNFGVGMIFALPNIAGFMTLTALLGLVSILISSFALIFIGITLGQWMRSRRQRYSAAARRRN